MMYYVFVLDFKTMFTLKLRRRNRSRVSRRTIISACSITSFINSVQNLGGCFLCVIAVNLKQMIFIILKKLVYILTENFL